MIQWKTLIEQLRHSETGLQQGIEHLYRDPALQKTARVVFAHHGKTLSLLTWEDLFTEAIIRLVDTIRKGGGPEKNPESFFYGICLNLCREHGRREDKIDRNKPVDEVRVLADVMRHPDEQDVRSIVLEQLRRLPEQCQTMLFLYYFEEPPITDYVRIAGVVNNLETNRQQEKQVKPGSIPTLLTRCRNKFREILRDQLDNLFHQ